MTMTKEAEVTLRRRSRFWDRVAEGYAKKPVADEAAYQKKLRVARDYFRPDMAVLEFGCGTGSTAIAQAPYVKHILATDISAKMIEIARGKLGDGKVGNVTFQQVTLDNLDLPEGSFDAVMGLNILHLLEDMDAAIAKVHRLLKPGGVFVSSTVCLGDFMGWFRFIAPLGRVVGLLPLVRIITKQDLLDALAAGGFEIDHQWHPGKRKGVFIVAKKRKQRDPLDLGLHSGPSKATVASAKM